MARQLPTDIPEETPATRSNRSNLVQQISETTKDVSTREREQRKVDPAMLASSGCTLINCACTDSPDGAYMLGGYATMPGASSAGKTLIALTTLAEATFDPKFDKYILIHDDAEERQAFDLQYMFGKRVADRICVPPLDRSKTIQQFKANVLTLQKNKSKFIYILDSFDSLSSDEELEKEMRKALAMAKSEEAAKKIAGSYGMEKAKIAGEILRMLNNYLKESDSLIIMTQQLRDNVGGGPFDPEYVTSGGNAPFFYSNHQIWLTKGAAHKKKELVIGHHVRAKIVKNSATGKLRNVEFDVFNELGLDNVGANVDFLYNEGFWRDRQIGGVKGISAPELDLFEPSRDKLVVKIEELGLEKELAKTVGEAWNRREATVKLGRKPRYL